MQLRFEIQIPWVWVKYNKHELRTLRAYLTQRGYLQWTSLEKRRLRGDFIEFFKIMKGIKNFEWSNPPKLMHQERSSRFHNQRIERQLTRVRTVRYDFLSNRIANHWNSLSQETVDSIDTNRFKNNIDASYFNY